MTHSQIGWAIVVIFFEINRGKFLSRLRLAKARHMRYFSGVVGVVLGIVGGGVNFFEFLLLVLYCDLALTGETPHSAEFLLFVKSSHVFTSGSIRSGLIDVYYAYTP